MQRRPAVLVDLCPFVQKGLDGFFVAVVTRDHQGIVAIERFRVDMGSAVGQQDFHDSHRIFAHCQDQPGVASFRFDGIGVESASQQVLYLSGLVVFDGDEPVIEGSGLCSRQAARHEQQTGKETEGKSAQCDGYRHGGANDSSVVARIMRQISSLSRCGASFLQRMDFCMVPSARRNGAQDVPVSPGIISSGFMANHPRKISFPFSG